MCAQMHIFMEQFSCIPVCGDMCFLCVHTGRYMSNPRGCGGVPRVKLLWLCRICRYALCSGGLTNCEGHEWARTSHLELCEDLPTDCQASGINTSDQAGCKPKSFLIVRPVHCLTSHVLPQQPTSIHLRYIVESGVVHARTTALA